MVLVWIRLPLAALPMILRHCQQHSSPPRPTSILLRDSTHSHVGRRTKTRVNRWDEAVSRCSSEWWVDVILSRQCGQWEETGMWSWLEKCLRRGPPFASTGRHGNTVRAFPLPLRHLRLHLRNPFRRTDTDRLPRYLHSPLLETFQLSTSHCRGHCCPSTSHCCPRK